MGINTENHGYFPILNMSMNFRDVNSNNAYLGAGFRIDARAPELPLFQWVKRDAGATREAEKVIMSLTQSGNLGIGILIPGERLSVNGNIRAKEIKVEVNYWPDYVFRDDYPLRSLSQLERYIKDNGHLPEIPDAASVGDQGISLGEMNKLLLKKIEELTLHLIAQDKKVSELSDKVKELKKL